MLKVAPQEALKIFTHRKPTLTPLVVNDVAAHIKSYSSDPSVSVQYLEAMASRGANYDRSSLSISNVASSNNNNNNDNSIASSMRNIHHSHSAFLTQHNPEHTSSVILANVHHTRIALEYVDEVLQSMERTVHANDVDHDDDDDDGNDEEQEQDENEENCRSSKSRIYSHL